MRVMVFDELPGWEVIYNAFMDYYNGKWRSENVKKTYMAPARGLFTVEGKTVYAGDYVIYDDGFEYLGTREPACGFIDDVVRPPGSRLPVDVRDLFASWNFYTSLTDDTSEIITDSANFFRFDRERGVYDVVSDENDTHGLYDLFRDYLSLTEAGRINVDTDFIMFTRVVDDWEVIVRKYQYNNRVEISIQSIFGGHTVKDFSVEGEFFDVLDLVANVGNILELLSLFIL